MASEIKILRLSTGEDVIAKVGENDQGISLNKAFVIIPQQIAPGKPVQLMMTPWMPYSHDKTITVDKDKVITIYKPKDDILKSYQQNTSSIISGQKPSLFTESSLPKL